MARSCFACSSVTHCICISLASLLISGSLTSKTEAFSTVCWHHSVISFGGIVLINSFTSLVVCFVINMTSYFACSWRRTSCCCLYRAGIFAIFFSFVLMIEILIISA